MEKSISHYCIFILYGNVKRSLNSNNSGIDGFAYRHHCWYRCRLSTKSNTVPNQIYQKIAPFRPSFTLSLVIFIFTSFLALSLSLLVSFFSSTSAGVGVVVIVVKNSYMKRRREYLSNYVTDILTPLCASAAERGGWLKEYINTDRYVYKKNTHASSRMNIKREFEVKKCTSAYERTLFCTLLS